MIRFVSLGPGDPELVTLKALRILQQSDVIFCPATYRQGRMLSRSGDILRALPSPLPQVQFYDLPMSKDRQAAEQVYNELTEQVISLAKQGQKVAITAEGDAGFYSSSQYIKERLADLGYHSTRVSGVPAFIDCASLADIHLASGETGLEVLPHVSDVSALLKPLNEGKNIVLMKVSQSEAIIKEAIPQMEPCYTLHYIENRGVAEKEFYSSDREEILARPFPYFSILIILQ